MSSLNAARADADATTVAAMAGDARIALQVLIASGPAGRSADPVVRAAQAAQRPAPSIRFEDFPQEIRKRQISIPAATAHLAGALHFHLE